MKAGKAEADMSWDWKQAGEKMLQHGGNMILDVVWDTLKDGLKLLPFLFLTYLIMEYIEHKAGAKAEQTVQKSGKWGPVMGALLGVIPQCGFSAAAANLYAGRIITLGTLFSVFLSTSDEMLPILISEKTAWSVIVKLLVAKIVIGMAAGFAVDIFLHKRKEKKKSISELSICASISTAIAVKVKF